MAQKITAAPQTRENALPLFPDGTVPTWEIAYLFPAQGSWTEADYFNLDGTIEGVGRAELSRGRLEVLPMPTELHQFILFFLAKALEAFSRVHAPGAVLPAGLRIRLGRNLFREPDVCYLRAEHFRRRREQYWTGADLVMEVVSGDAKDIKRDWETKPREYARAGIPEYWIVDPRKQVIRVLTLAGKSYKVHGDFGPGDTATSVLLPGFAVSVDEVLAAGGDTED
jgi:Uma2 family endonuclease